MTTTFYANTELVACAWLSEIFPSSMVATTLPEDNTTWAASGFIQVTSLGGSSDGDVPMIHPVINIDCWATKPNSNRPPWRVANNNAEMIRHAVYAMRPHKVTLPTGYPQAQLYSADVVSEPRRVPDISSYARFNMMVSMFWAPAVWS